MSIYKNLKKYQKNSGFTLVEMAVVILVLGILASLILKAQELIVNSQMTSTISELENLGGAVNTFQDSYGVYPGDMSNASFRLPNCNADPCNDGDGDGEIDVAIGVANVTSEEGAYFFGHLRAAELLTRLDGTNNTSFGSAFPATPIGGGYIVGDTNIAGENAFDLTEMRSGVYLLLVGQNQDIDANSGVLTPAQAERIDRTLDDGRPDTGGIISQNTANSCRNALAPPGYDENQIDQLCVIAIRMPRPNLRP